MTNPITERLTEQKINFGCGWEAGYKGLYDSVKSYDDLRKLILSDDTNTKIFTISNMVPVVLDLLTHEQKQELSSILRQQLSDNRMCDIHGSSLYADEDDTTTVSKSARVTLDRLESLLESKKQCATTP